MDEANLVGVHEAGIAHHVAAVGEVDGEHRAAAVGNGRGAVVVQLLIALAVGAHVAAGEALFKVLEEDRIDGHDVFEVAVLGAVLDHEDFAVALDDLGLDFADFFVEEDFVGQLAVENLLADLGDALGTKRVSGARPAEGRLLLLIAFEKRLVAPLGRKGGVRTDAVQTLKNNPGSLGRVDGGLLDVLDSFGHECGLLYGIEGAGNQSVARLRPRDFVREMRRLRSHYEGSRELRSTQAGCSEWRNRGLDGELGAANGGQRKGGHGRGK